MYGHINYFKLDINVYFNWFVLLNAFATIFYAINELNLKIEKQNNYIIYIILLYIYFGCQPNRQVLDC